MMDTIINLIHAFWQHDLTTLSNPALVTIIYSLAFVTIFLENSILPLAFLPGDSLLILIGVLVAKDVLSYPYILILLTIAATLGSWLSYLQGKWLSHSKLITHWLTHLPTKYQQRSQQLFDRYGLLALFISRFLAFIRTLSPLLVGMTQLNNRRFIYFNFISAFLWIFILLTLGFILGNTTLYNRYETEFFRLLTLIPIGLLLLSLISSCILTLHKCKSR